MSKPTQTILITGATAGIGRHAALYLASPGHRVIATGRKEHALEELALEGHRMGVTIDTLVLDVTDETSIRQAKADVAELTNGRGLDVLINNAGYGLAAPAAEATDADLRHQFDTNVFGLMAVTRAFLPDMIQRGRGRVLNVSSVGGRITFPMMGPYHASKYAVEALSDALRLELRPFGVDVVLIEPGPIQTNFIDRMNQAASPYRESSLYAPIFERADLIEARTMAMSPGPEVISRAIERAVTARRPRARYVAPFASRFMLGLLSWLPTPMRDGLMRAVFGINKKQLAARPQLAAAA